MHIPCSLFLVGAGRSVVCVDLQRNSLHALIADIEGSDVHLMYKKAYLQSTHEAAHLMMLNVFFSFYVIWLVLISHSIYEATRPWPPILLSYVISWSILQGRKTQPGKSKRMHPCCTELLSSFVTRWTTLPVAGSPSIRMTFHNLPLQMPPPPGTEPHISDNMYRSN